MLTDLTSESSMFEFCKLFFSLIFFRQMECAIRTIPDSGQLVKDIALGKTPVASGMYQVFRRGFEVLIYVISHF